MMKTKNIQLYKSAEAYMEAPEGMKNEMQMWFVAGGLLMQELSKRMGNKPYGGLRTKVGYKQNKKLKQIEILDVCSGLGNFPNHLSFIYPKIKAFLIDTSKEFLEYSKSNFKTWKSIEANAVNFSLNKKFDFITASSAYHHIEDKNKLKFLNNLKNHLKDNGIIIVCENFLPDYPTEEVREKSVEKYYNELESFYKRGNATKNSIKAIEDVKNLEIAGEEEHKVSFRIFENHIRQAGLVVESDLLIWQPDPFFVDKAGSHVIVLKKEKT